VTVRREVSGRIVGGGLKRGRIRRRILVSGNCGIGLGWILTILVARSHLRRSTVNARQVTNRISLLTGYSAKSNGGEV
jgi:hypothetical protein